MEVLTLSDTVDETIAFVDADEAVLEAFNVLSNQLVHLLVFARVYGAPALFEWVGAFVQCLLRVTVLRVAVMDVQLLGVSLKRCACFGHTGGAMCCAVLCAVRFAGACEVDVLWWALEAALVRKGLIHNTRPPPKHSYLPACTAPQQPDAHRLYRPPRLFFLPSLLGICADSAP